MYDPFPGQMLLTLAQVAQLMACDAKTLRRFRSEDPTFPKPIQLGKPSKSSSRLRFRKPEVLVWILSQRPASDS